MTNQQKALLSIVLHVSLITFFFWALYKVSVWIAVWAVKTWGAVYLIKAAIWLPYLCLSIPAYFGIKWAYREMEAIKQLRALARRTA